MQLSSDIVCIYELDALLTVCKVYQQMHMHSFATCGLMRLLSGFEVFFSTPAVVFLLICRIAQKRANESENFCYNSLRIFRAIGENIPELIPRFERH